MYTFIEDPGHGWIEVPTAELVSLGVAAKISAYSYQSRDGHLSYLEEDCDLSTFLRAKGCDVREFFANNVRMVHTNSEAFVRALPHFRAVQS